MTDLKPIIDLIQAALIPGLLYGIKLLWDIRDHLARLNGRVTKCEELRQAHERSDKEKHDSCEERIAFIEHTMIGRKG
ncbi:MAG TPA: hypothetical protein VN444_04535 [Verrucomicrobiae bacterium]|nr:hypothetical protein [Verrucomicrobiae bacterium]